MQSSNFSRLLKASQISTRSALIGCLILSGCYSLNTEQRDESPNYETARTAQTSSTDSADSAIDQNWLSAALKEIAATEYQPSLQEKDDAGNPLAKTKWHLTNRSNNFRSYVDASGWEITPREVAEGEKEWSWKYSFQRLERDSTRSQNSNAAKQAALETVQEDKNTVHIQHGAGLTEWYTNSEKGIEQGFRIENKLAANNAGALVLRGLVDSNLDVSSSSGEQVTFSTSKADVLRYDGLKVIDANGKELKSWMELDKSGEQLALNIHIDDSKAEYPILVDPLASSPSWMVSSSLAFSNFAYSVSTAGDVNNDGYDDVIIGADGYNNSQSGEGAAFVYHGSRTGLSTSANWSKESNQTDARFGHSVSAAGDVNNDGYDDVIIGSPGYDTTGHNGNGVAFVYYGSANGLSASANWTGTQDQDNAGFGNSVSSAGDVNQDGYADVIVATPTYENLTGSEGRVFVYQGSANGLSTSPDWFVEANVQNFSFDPGVPISSAGDVNGDGYSDILVVSGDSNGVRSEVSAYHGSESGLSESPNWTVGQNQDYALFGFALSSAGDVNNDGYSDVIISSPYYDNGQNNEGAVFVYHGSADGLSDVANWTQESNIVNHTFGKAVSFAGDVNGDNYSDVVIGDLSYNNGQTAEGRALVYIGSADGLSTSAYWTFESNQANSRFAHSVSTAGDVNGDGYDDLLVGAFGASKAFAFYGSTDRPSVSITSSATSPTKVLPIPITITFNKAVTGFTIDDIRVTNGTPSNFAGSGSTYTAKITSSLEGTVVVRVAANAAQDAAGNLNLVSNQFSIKYGITDTDGDGTVNVVDTDDDNDGVLDTQEALDGTNPLDLGSYLATLPASWCSEWDSTLGLVNFNEYLNLDNTSNYVQTRLYSATGVAQSPVNAHVPYVAQSKLNTFPGWVNNSRGKVCSAVVNGAAGDMDGRTVYYKPSGTSYEFAFAAPFQNGIKGRQFVMQNTDKPYSSGSGHGGNAITNIVYLTNLASTSQSGTLYIYKRPGQLESSRRLTIAASKREAVLTDPSQFEFPRIALIEWKPDSSSAPFLMHMVRYYYAADDTTIKTFDAAAQFEGLKGSGEKLSVPVDTTNRLTVLEVANTTSQGVFAYIKFYTNSGTLLYNERLTIPAHGTLELPANELLNNALGMATIEASSFSGAPAPGSLIAYSMHYGTTGLPRLSYAYGIIAKEAVGSVLRGSYNTFAGQGCHLLLVNNSSSSVGSSVSMKRSAGANILSGFRITTPANGIFLYNLCSKDTTNQFGSVTVQPDSAGAIFPTIVRIGAGNVYRFPTAVR